MDQEENFSNLPTDIILDILSRIPIKTVFTCKRVCKSWLELLKTPEFARSHLSKSVPRVLIRYATEEDVFKVIEFEESVKMDRYELHYITVLELDVKKSFNLSYAWAVIVGSANGLVFFRDTDYHHVCNPITREYIKLPEPEAMFKYPGTVSYGFGVSRRSNQYKAVIILHERVVDPHTIALRSIPYSVCQVYTLGTESWRYVTTPCEMLDYTNCCLFGKLFNGNLHWLPRGLTGTRWILCFDLETEVFTQFQAPTVESGGSSLVDIGVLRNRLCVCDHSSENELSIYVMNDYEGEKKSWSKEYVLGDLPLSYDGLLYDFAYVMSISGDGDLLIVSNDLPFICYSKRTKNITIVNRYGLDVTPFHEAISYTPSFVSLKDFEMENAKLF